MESETLKNGLRWGGKMVSYFLPVTGSCSFLNSYESSTIKMDAVVVGIRGLIEFSKGQLFLNCGGNPNLSKLYLAVCAIDSLAFNGLEYFK